jgi:hypothetical protein
VLIRHLWQIKSGAFLHWFLIHAVLLPWSFNVIGNYWLREPSVVVGTLPIGTGLPSVGVGKVPISRFRVSFFNFKMSFVLNNLIWKIYLRFFSRLTSLSQMELCIFKWRHGTQHNDTMRNDKNATFSITPLSVMAFYTKCHYDECHLSSVLQIRPLW